MHLFMAIYYGRHAYLIKPGINRRIMNHGSFVFLVVKQEVQIQKQGSWSTQLSIKAQGH